MCLFLHSWDVKEFVIGIDEQILEYFLPVRCTVNLEATKFAIVAKIEDEVQTPFFEGHVVVMYLPCSFSGVDVP